MAENTQFLNTPIVSMPDYSRAVPVLLDKTHSFTAPQSGWLFFQVNSGSSSVQLFVNGKWVSYQGTGHANNTSVLVPLNEGDVASTNVAADDRKNSFIPFVGDKDPTIPTQNIQSNPETPT